MKKIFYVHVTTNGGHRAVDSSTGKVEPLVAGEASFDAAKVKLETLHEGCLVLEDREQILATLAKFEKLVQTNPGFAYELKTDIATAAREFGIDADSSLNLAYAVVQQVFVQGTQPL